MSKYEKDEKAKTFIYADDISVYPQKAMEGKITYGNPKFSEQKNLPIKVRLIKTKGRPLQFVLELQGDYHVEDLAYYSSVPRSWRSYGKIWLDLKNSKEFAEWILAALEVYNPKQKESKTIDKWIN